MPNIAFLNNKYIPLKDAKIPIEDRGFQFSDSVYEVVKIINKNILDFNFHMRRLKYSTSELSFNFKVKNKSEFEKIEELISIKNSKPIDKKFFLMGEEKELITEYHTRTKRDYIERMLNQKVKCMKVAKKYAFDYWDGQRTRGWDADSLGLP